MYLEEVLLWSLARIPLQWADRFAWVLAGFWWWILPIRRQETVERLQAVLSDVAPGPTLRRMMHDLILGYVEMVQFSKVQVVFSGEEGPIQEPGWMLFGHFGSWDTVILAIAERIPLAIFTRRIQQPRVRALLGKWREEHQVHCLETGSTLLDAQRMQSDGKNVVFVQDQRHNKGIAIPFFGKPARTAVGFAVSVWKTPERPIWTLYQWREGVGRHRVHVERLMLPPLTGEKERDIRLITEASMRWYEARIRERPWGWLWLHRRWK